MVRLCALRCVRGTRNVPPCCCIPRVHAACAAEVPRSQERVRRRCEFRVCTTRGCRTKCASSRMSPSRCRQVCAAFGMIYVTSGGGLFMRKPFCVNTIRRAGYRVEPKWHQDVSLFSSRSVLCDVLKKSDCSLAFTSFPRRHQGVSRFCRIFRPIL